MVNKLNDSQWAIKWLGLWASLCKGKLQPIYLCSETELGLVPEATTLEAAAAIPLASQTAVQALDELAFMKGKEC